MPSSSNPQGGQSLGFLDGGGELGALIRAFDWSSTPLGPINSWPQSLKSTVGLMLSATRPMALLWGEEGVLLYNDGYAAIAGPRHPAVLGMGVREAWPEVRDFNDGVVRSALAGETVFLTRQELRLQRSGQPETAWFDLDYTPVRDEDGRPLGALALVTEITDQVRMEQRSADEAGRQRRLFEQAPGFIIVMRGPEHIIEFVNVAHRKMFGSDNWIGKSIREAFASIEGQGFFERLDDVFASGETFEATAAEVRYSRTPGGPEEVRYHSFLYAPLYGDNGEISGIFCQGFDVTDAHIASRHAMALAELGDRIRDVDDPDELAYQAASILGQTLGVSRAGYGTINVQNETIAIERDWNMPGVKSLAGLLHFRDYGSYIEDLKAGRTVVIEDAQKDPRSAEGADALRAISAQAFVNMPVTEQGGFVALLYLNHATPRVWRDSELALIREVAGRTRTGVERRRAEAALRANEARLRFLDALAQATQALTDADEILAVTTRMAAEHMGVSMCAYADMDEDEDGFTIRGDWSAPGSPSIVGHYSLAAFGKMAVRNLGAGQPLVLNDIRAELDPDEAATFQAIGIGATICMPLVKQGRLTALMAVHHKEPHRWTEEELATIREVTERSWAHVQRVGAEAEKRNSEARYAALFNSIDEGFCIIEFLDGPHGPMSDYIHVEANPAYTLNAGIADVVGQKVREMVPDEAEGWIELYRRVLVTGEPIRFEKELEATSRWLELAAFRIEPPSRRQVAVLFKDLTDRRRAEQALRASEENFRTLSRVMPNQAWTSLPDGTIDWYNEQVYTYTGAAPGTLTGRTGWAPVAHPDDVARSAGKFVTSLETGEPYENEVRLRRHDGAWRWHIVRAVAVRNRDGRIVRWIGTNTDIQDQKEVAETLEQRVEERTSQLMQAEEALRQSQKMEAVGQLTGGIAHDFNNLLGGISGSLELLEKRIGEGRLEGVQRYITSAQEASRRAASLTQRLLAFSRRQTLDPKPIDANKLIAGMEDLIRRTVGPTITVEVVGAGGLWPTRADASQLENSLLNLCINARDAMAPEGGRLTIETANKWLDERAARDRDLPPGQYISICVTDTGTGMTPDIIARAFDPFFTTKPIGQGTGLGLSMVYGFVRQSNGQVRIYSEVGKGTTMCLYLPRFFGKLEEADAPPTDEIVDKGAGETVLVIDDEPILRMLIIDVLEENGYRALEAVDGPSGLKILESDTRIDLLITDVGLPGGMNGRQVADAARRLRPDLKVLFITGYAENAVIGNGHLEPGMEVLTKPFPVATLGQRIRSLIEA